MINEDEARLSCNQQHQREITRKCLLEFCFSRCWRVLTVPFAQSGDGISWVHHSQTDYLV